jgi:hypothetical protein
MKKMEKIEHKAFMESNQLDSSTFSDGIQRKIKIFNEMSSRLEDTIDDDRKKLLKRLKGLDHEIHEDMLNELEDELENNEVVEETEKKQRFKKEDTVEIIGGNPKYIGVIATVIAFHPPSGNVKESVTIESSELRDGKAIYSIENVKATSKKPQPAHSFKKGSTDEEILEELFKIKKTKGLGRSFLKECGIKTNITGWTIQIGDYVLNRTAIFSYKYNLEKLKM